MGDTLVLYFVQNKNEDVMPGLRYGPDFTDDAEIVRTQLARLEKLVKTKRGGTKKNKQELKNLNDIVKKAYGGRKGLNQLAKYSTKQMGYDESGKTKTLAGVTFRGRPPIDKKIMAARRAKGLPNRRQMGAIGGNARLGFALNKPGRDATRGLAQRKAREDAVKAAKKAKRAKAAKKARAAKKATKKKQAAKKAVAKKRPAAKKAASRRAR